MPAYVAGRVATEAQTPCAQFVQTMAVERWRRWLLKAKSFFQKTASLLVNYQHLQRAQDVVAVLTLRELCEAAALCSQLG